ncbi:MAG: ASCH domain-containing protein, partial [Nakamurella sp.]
MLISPVIAQGIRDGSVTAVFRAWDAPRVKVGGTQRTAAGVVRFEALEPVELAQLTDADARAAGMASLAALIKANQRGRGAQLYRIRVTFDRVD